EGHAKVGFESEFISVADVPCDTMGVHPWSIGGGGAAELRELLEKSTEQSIRKVAEFVGFTAILGEDEAYMLPLSARRWMDLPHRPLIEGDGVRDLAINCGAATLFPFDAKTLDLKPDAAVLQKLWMFRRLLEMRIVSGS